MSEQVTVLRQRPAGLHQTAASRSAGEDRRRSEDRGGTDNSCRCVRTDLSNPAPNTNQTSVTEQDQSGGAEDHQQHQRPHQGESPEHVLHAAEPHVRSEHRHHKCVGALSLVPQVLMQRECFRWADLRQLLMDVNTLLLFCWIRIGTVKTIMFMCCHLTCRICSTILRHSRAPSLCRGSRSRRRRPWRKCAAAALGAGGTRSDAVSLSVFFCPQAEAPVR